MNQSSDKEYLAYIRVSSDRQTLGTSLLEQRSHITRYAETNGLSIASFYEEVESASKAGRSKFDEMIRDLQSGLYEGVIFHKVDRSARNPKDQAILYDLMINGCTLRFVAEGISTAQPLGRNMIYMLWGMASGYSENLRAEINKGILGRLKQGRLSASVPIGYKKGEECKAIIDPKRAPLVKQLFDDYASGEYSVQMLVKRAKELGLTNRNNKYISKNSLHIILRQTFYYGLITHRKGVFPGEHTPLITKATFDKVQYYLAKKGFKRKYRHIYSFGGLLKCPRCKTTLKSMTAKGKWKYYYCRTKDCPVKALAETQIHSRIKERLKEVELSDQELTAFRQAVKIHNAQTQTDASDQITAIMLELTGIESRLDSLVTKLADGTIDDESYSKARKRLLDKQIELRERRDSLERVEAQKFAEIEQLGKLLKSPALSYEMADPIKKRRLILAMVENLELVGNDLTFTWRKPFEMIANRPKPEFSALGRNRTYITSSAS